MKDIRHPKQLLDCHPVVRRKRWQPGYQNYFKFLVMKLMAGF